MKRILLLLIIVLMTAACSIPSLDQVLSDTRTDYKKSKSLPPLDVPPDLSASEAKGSTGTSGGTMTASLKAYQNRNNPQQKGAADTQSAAETQSAADNQKESGSKTATSTAAPAISVPLPKLDADGGAFITVRGGKAEVWKKLRDFFAGKGYQLALDDVDLGYMETDWSAPAVENGHTYRHKFKVYSETGKEPGVTGLYIDNEQQEQVTGAGGKTTWQDANKNADVERLMAGAMNVYFNGMQEARAQVARQSASATAATDSVTPASGGAAAPAATHTASALPDRAEIRDLGDNKILLAVPEEYTLAWRRTGEALQKAGLEINASDQNKGVYHITYQGAKPKQSGWLSKLKKLKFWGKHESKGAGTYQVALTGVGDKTEIVVLDEDGGWANNETADSILSMIKTQYNRL